MSDATSLITEIIRELTSIQGKPPRSLVEEGDFPIPSMIPAGDERGIWSTKGIERNITTLARLFHAEDATLALRYTDAEWRTSVRSALGPQLARIDLDDDVSANAATVLAATRATLAAPAGVVEEREHALACTLFGKLDTTPFAIGPLQFEPRKDWLKRKTDDGGIPPEIAERVLAQWGGQTTERPTENLTYLLEKSILDGIGACPFVCSLKTVGYASDAGKEKALTAARLGLTVIALVWQTPSKTLEGFNLLYDRSVRHQSALSFTPGKITLPGSKLSHMPHGPTLQAGEWEKELTARAPYFRVCGEIIEYMLNADGSVARPNLMNTLAQAFIWFHEACRETVALISIVNFSAAMDALACGRKSSGIRQLINSRLGIADDKPVFAGGPTLKAAIDLIYSEGRSRAIHGVSKKIGHDWSNARDLAEQLARLSLATCVVWAANHPDKDDPELLRT